MGVVNVLLRGCVRVVQGVAFWSAVVLPAVYIPPLFVGSPWVVTGSAVGYLILLNTVAVVVGHGHRSERGQRETVSYQTAD